MLLCPWSENFSLTSGVEARGYSVRCEEFVACGKPGFRTVVVKRIVL